MELQIRNIGKIEKADIVLDGITVLTGDNDTGKSTIGKVLYCLFTAFHNAQDSALIEKKRALTSLFYSEFRNLRSSIKSRNGGADYFVRRRISDTLQDSIINGKFDYHTVQEKIEDLFSRFDVDISPVDLQEMFDHCREIIELDDLEVMDQILDNEFEKEFGTSSIMTLQAIFSSSIQLKIRDQEISLYQEKLGEKIKLRNYLDLVKTIIYIDDPFIMDNMDGFGYPGRSNHRRVLLHMLSQRAKDSTVVSEIVAQRRLQNVMEKMRTICDGQLVQSEQGEYQYQSDTLSGTIPIQEVSTGLKSFLILKQLLISGQLEENGVVVLDEPEVHLHPQWQIAFSELIVMLHQEFHINFMITTHSIDFLTAIEYYSKKYQITEKCHYYLLEKNEVSNLTSARETSGHLDEAYAKLSRPFLELTSKLEDEF